MSRCSVEREHRVSPVKTYLWAASCWYLCWNSEWQQILDLRDVQTRSREFTHLKWMSCWRCSRRNSILANRNRKGWWTCANPLKQGPLVCCFSSDRRPVSRCIRFRLGESKTRTREWTDATTTWFRFGTHAAAQQADPPGCPTSIISQRKGHHTSASVYLPWDAVDWIQPCSQTIGSCIVDAIDERNVSFWEHII